MDNWSCRFSSDMDECVHLILALILSENYEAQRHELVARYGNVTTAKAYNIVMNDYKTLITRF